MSRLQELIHKQGNLLRDTEKKLGVLSPKEQLVRSFENLRPTVEAIGFRLAAIGSRFVETLEVDIAGEPNPHNCRMVLLDLMNPKSSTVKTPYMQAGSLISMVDHICNEYLPKTYRVYSPILEENLELEAHAMHWMDVNEITVQTLLLPSIKAWFYPDPVVHEACDMTKVVAVKLSLEGIKEDMRVHGFPLHAHIHIFSILSRDYVGQWLAGGITPENCRKLAALVLVRIWQEIDDWAESKGQSFLNWWEQAQENKLESIDTSIQLDNEVGFRQALLMQEKYKAFRAWLKQLCKTPLSFESAMMGDYDLPDKL